jgi:hypothetical protein
VTRGSAQTHAANGRTVSVNCGGGWGAKSLVLGVPDRLGCFVRKKFELNTKSPLGPDVVAGSARCEFSRRNTAVILF